MAGWPSGYLDVLEDTLVLFRVPAWRGSDRASLVAHPKVLLFDLGVRNALRDNSVCRDWVTKGGSLGSILATEACLDFEVIRRVLAAYQGPGGCRTPEAALRPAGGGLVPIRRFRSVEEMSEPPWREPGTAALWRAIEAVWALGARTGVHRFPPGIYRHRTIESLNALSETWAEANFRAFREAQAVDRAGLDRSRSE